MAGIERTGRQKALLVLSILSVLYGCMTLVTALVAHFAAGTYASVIGEQMTQILDSVWPLSAVDGALVAAMGITGITASRNAQAATPAVVVGMAAFVLTLFMQQRTGGGIIAQIASGNLNPYLVFHVLLVALTAGLAYTVRYEGTR